MIKKTIIKYLIFLVITVLIFSFIFFGKFSKKEDNKFIFTEINQTTNLYIFDFPAITLFHNKEKPEFISENINSIYDKKKFDIKLRSKLLELLQKPLPSEHKYNYKFLEEIDKGEYIQKKLLLFPSNLTFSYAYLLIPKNVTFPAPAILAMHQHGGNYENGKDEVVGNKGNPDLFYGKELAEKGYIVLSIDSSLFGDRIDLGQNSREKEEIREAQNLIALGHSLLGVVVQEDLVSLDFLANLEIVNKNNIGCIGHSMGGVRCMYLAALDNRVKATVISNAIAYQNLGYPKAIKQTWFTILPGITKYSETDAILSLIAPRPLFVLYSENDPIFPSDEAKNIIGKVEKVYAILDSDSKFISLYALNQSHSLPKEYRTKLYSFLDKNLKK